ncbi:Vhr1-domain-containing protein [Metschnikowia bicuspidata var. bicuspidata NRRL YB-4993]|uniref:Vhr1-domain-containing protein n=1 Tax=Metschnikowia bicuspidata var. bicuspidata NRRL YB-4993 TaxID=869754 RepID=A0A1A0H5N8_9ASCO|nr:Vhr1-domain-containing protein [Metschnikowia bicuspidata var. bicuspidata NRRL YB-4993]OBA19270.1 Vhr1-domain-containing protein [Metschnikowia bicuspidata var. bicuspidata NRRL YB-4993]
MYMKQISMPRVKKMSLDSNESFDDSGRQFLVRLFEDKKLGVTHAIRQRLGFDDSRLWKRFLARRLELIDTLDLSSKKASDQEDEIRRVAEVLRIEFRYDSQYFTDFDKLVRAAVQSVRRNRKRGTKTGRANLKRRHLDSESQSESSSTYTPSGPSSVNPEKNLFLSEISNLNTDGSDSLYDMSYSTSRVISSLDRARAAIDSIIRPTNIERKMSQSGIQLPPLLNVALAPHQLDNEKALLTLRLSLLWLMKRSKLCLSLASLHKNESLKIIGQSSITTVNALMLESSFSGLTHTSVEYLRDRLSLAGFQARFYRSLEPECPISGALDDETAVSTLETLVGCCVKDFGFDSVLYLIGEAFYFLILLEYPLVLRSSVHFRRVTDIPQAPGVFHRDFAKDQPVSLSNLAAVASELRSQAVSTSPSTDTHLTTTPVAPLTQDKKEKYLEVLPLPSNPEKERKQVKLKFLSSSLNFMFSIKNSAPPRFVEIVDNAKQAFRLNENQIYGLRNSKSGLVINTDLDLEQIFAHEQEIELEVFTQKFSPIPFSEITTAITPNPSSEDRSKIVLPLPLRQNVPPVLPSPIDRAHLPGYPRLPFLPKFQPLL